jgi:hypothetical protein
MQKINIEKLWDDQKVCENPHKGWYHHYYDNSLKVYGPLLEPDDFLEDFPGLNHIYLRVDWSHLEPEEGKYDWEVIDRIINPWTQHGYAVSFRICCKETSPGFATPEWVMKAGANGTFFPTRDGNQCWEPDYGDPIFLEKLDNFHRVFAERYGDMPWLEFVDIGSYGEWGEGHTSASSRRDWPADVIKRHIDIHTDHYTNTFILMNNDMVDTRKVEDGSKEEIYDYALSKGLGMRDDSVCVKWYFDTFGKSTLLTPECFTRVWRNKPVDIELEHYGSTIRHNTWMKGLPLVAAVEESHATFVGFHGDARKWLADNLEIAVKLANLSGYWYFLKSIEMNMSLSQGTEQKIKLVWENHGVAPSYYRYKMMVRLANDNHRYEQELTDSDNRNWMPGDIVLENYVLNIPKDLTPGKYKLGIALYEDKGFNKRDIQLALKDSTKAKDNFYDIVEVGIGQ